MHTPRLIAIPIILLLTLGACGGARAATATGHMMGADAARERARADSLRYPYVQGDIDFMSGMIHHHAQAITMSRMAPTHGAGAAVVRLSERIINAQLDEITTMRLWLLDRGQAAPAVDSAGNIEMDHGAHGAHGGHSMTMPGMLTTAQLAELDAARGAQFDRLFLNLMIQHHRGAVQMVRQLFATHGAGQDETIFKIASDVEADQTTEINRMVQMLIEHEGGAGAE